MGCVARAAIGALALGGAGCALVSGLSNLDVAQGNASDASTLDGGADGDTGAPPPPVDGGGCTCGNPVPPGFTPVVFSKSPCPFQLAKETVYVDPQTVTATGTCTCTCAMGGCAGGTATYFDGTNCFLTIGTTPVNGTCVAFPNNVGATSSIGIAGATPSCTASGSFPSPYSSTMRLCTPQTADCTAFCNQTAQQACWIAPGDVACPTGLVKSLVAASVTDTRACNGCSCTVSNGGCSTTLSYYGNSTCTLSADAGLTATGACTNTGVTGTFVRGTATPTGSCTSQPGTATGTTTPTNVRTVCCK